ncbi:GH24712 [Drosophila grimshawi]|uniref:non-specific serine/threonine protein kinase n=3 Tax=Drosophila grimshawi TaxID=7222 RepID=B4JMY4_DROGR|nr:GH24712 [Drosophila grimshawi]
MPPTTTTFSPRINKQQQQAVTTTTATFNHKQQYNHINNNNNNNNNNGNNALRLQKQTPAATLEQYALGNNSSRTKPRNKSEEAISDLLHRIPDIGQIFNVQSRIGNGTFSTVLLATLKREAQLPDGMRRKFAIKHHIPTSHPDRIMKELQCMTDMGGTNNVVGVHCCLRYEASAAFVMPYMPHDRFHDFYTKMDVSEIRLYMHNLLQALRHVHKFNVIHRDVKPSNFLYNRRQGQFLLVDFGLAQHVNVSQQQQLHLQLQQQQPALRGGGSGKAMLSNSSKRPREREVNSNQQQQQLPTTTTMEATLGGAVKRMRLIDDQAVSNWNKMPLKPVNSAIAAQSAKQQSALNEDATVSANQATGNQQQMPSQLPSNIQQPEQSAPSVSKYNTNRTAGGASGAVGGASAAAAAAGGALSGSKCFCFANPSVCLNCLMKKEVHASRAGTPGYRPPEVLLKYADQTTAVDVWAAGVIFLSILSSVYPFFKAPNDFVALAEIVTIFGDRAIRKTALALERMVTLSQRSKPLNLRSLCLRFRHRLIFSDQRMVRKYESADGRILMCKNCDQYSFNCLCEETLYVTEPLDPYECFPESAYDLLGQLLEINPHKRISAEEALNHPFFTEPQANNINTTSTSNTAAKVGRHNDALRQTTRRRATKAEPEAEAGMGSGAVTVAGGVSGQQYAADATGTATAEQLHPNLNKL